MLLQGLSDTPNRKSKEHFPQQLQKRKVKRKTKKVANLTVEQQVTCFAEIIVNQLLNELSFYEK